jgi:hypothetical protein
MSRGPTPMAGQSIAQLRQTPIERAGRMMVEHLHSLLRNAAMYGAGHPSVIAGAQRFAVDIKLALDELDQEALALLATDDYLYLGRDPIRADDSLADRATWVRETMHTLKVRELRLSTDVNAELLAHFADTVVTLLAEHRTLPPKNTGALQVHRGQRNEPLEALLEQTRHARRLPLLQLYGEGYAHTREWASMAKRGHHAAEVVAKRIAGQLIDGLSFDRGGMLGLLALMPRPGSFTNRRFDSALSAIAIAHALGLGDENTLELGVAALVRPTPETWPVWWQRNALLPHEASKLAVQSKSAIERILAYESCAPAGLRMDNTWYDEPRQKHISTRIVAIAEGYVDLCQPGDSATPFAPELALEMLRSQAGEFFDREIVEVFASMMGAYPPGSAVMLNSGDPAVVIAPPPAGSPRHRPAVRLLQPGNREVFYLHRDDLAAYSIERGAEPSECPLNPMFSFLQ